MPLRRYPEVRLIDSRAGDWSEGSGSRVMTEMLNSGDRVDCVFGQNDRMALGARKVLMDRQPDSKAFRGHRRPCHARRWHPRG